MKERGKSIKSDQESTKFNQDYNFYYSSSSGIPCKRHPSSTQVGICPHCLKERLMKLVCSDCGEQRLSSCSCSDISSYRNSSCTVDIGSVGRISFLIENEKAGSGDEQKTLFSHVSQQSKKRETEDVIMLKRSNSCFVEVKKSNGFWRIGKLFKKKREKDDSRERNSEIWDVSRSRSLCSFRGAAANGGNLDHENVISDMNYSSAKISDFNESEPRKSGFSLKSGFMDYETGKETEFQFTRLHDDSGFIDLKLDLSDKSKTEYSVFNNKTEYFANNTSSSHCGCDNGSSSCKITVNERGIRKGNKGRSKVWKWFFKQHSGKKDLNHILES